MVGRVQQVMLLVGVGWTLWLFLRCQEKGVDIGCIGGWALKLDFGHAELDMQGGGTPGVQVRLFAASRDAWRGRC